MKMTNLYTSYDQLPLSLDAEDVAKTLNISQANAYVLLNTKGFPVIRIGKRMVVMKDKLLAWIEQHEAN